MREDGPPSPLRLRARGRSTRVGAHARGRRSTTIMSRAAAGRRAGHQRRHAARHRRGAGRARLPSLGRRDLHRLRRARRRQVLERIGAARSRRRQSWAGSSRRGRAARGGCSAPRPDIRADRLPRPARQAISVAQFHAVRAFRRRRGRASCSTSTARTPRSSRRRGRWCSPPGWTPAPRTSRPAARSCRSRTRSRACSRAAPPPARSCRAISTARPRPPARGASRTTRAARSRPSWSAIGGASRLESAPLERPGLYRVLLAGALRNTFAVNPDVRESDLDARSRARHDRRVPGRPRADPAPRREPARRVREARYGRELWTWFVVLALLLLVIETIVARVGADDADAGAEPRPRSSSLAFRSIRNGSAPRRPRSLLLLCHEPFPKARAGRMVVLR